jgi:hypothetical protein
MTLTFTDISYIVLIAILVFIVMDTIKDIIKRK